VSAYGDFRFSSEHRFFEVEGEVLAQVGSALCATATTPATRTAENIAETEEIAKDVAEILEDAGIETGRSRGGCAYTSVSKAIIESALLLVGENRVRFAALLKLLFGVRIGITVRMVL
jgi:hypothetical protein